MEAADGGEAGAGADRDGAALRPKGLNARVKSAAVWWIKAAIQEYILRSWSLVKMGTTANQKKLFFNLRKAKSKISAYQSTLFCAC